MGIKKAIFPGSFDPFTKGHEEVVRKALQVVDEVIIAIGSNSGKTKRLFDIERSKKHIQSLFLNQPVQIMPFEGLLTDFCQAQHGSFIVRGLRDTKDFEFEKALATMNHDLAGIETLFLLTGKSYAAINASMVREIYLNGGDLNLFVTNAHELIT
ncbi:MAG: pantetheine-phosphate adenylyltransferase [Flavobacteriales bacterium]